MKIKLSWLFLFFICLSGCDNQEFIIHSSGLKYRYIEHNQTAVKPAMGDVLKLNMCLLTETDSVLYKGLFEIELKPASHSGGAVEDGLDLLHVGDSAHFVVCADSFYVKTLRDAQPVMDTKKYKNLIFQVRLMDFMAKEQVQKQKELAIKERQALEEQLLMDYIEKEKIEEAPTASGLYFISVSKGKGKRPLPGQMVEVNYSGRLINGQVFDSSYKRNEPLRFILGAGEVISGWEEGIAMMEEGSKVKLIIPSHLAYGAESRGQFIAPYSTLIFDVELIRIIK